MPPGDGPGKRKGSAETVKSALPDVPRQEAHSRLRENVLAVVQDYAHEYGESLTIHSRERIEVMASLVEEPHQTRVARQPRERFAQSVRRRLDRRALKRRVVPADLLREIEQTRDDTDSADQIAEVSEGFEGHARATTLRTATAIPLIRGIALIVSRAVGSRLSSRFTDTPPSS